MSQVVVISGHPDLEQSHTNTVVLEQLNTALDSVDVRCLDTLYPDYQVDIEAEQLALLDADVIVLQFPLYWYSVPALLKKWIDDVLAYNFAYGAEGDKLRGKALILSFTVGGPEEAYTPLGYNHFSIAQLMYPIQQTAYLAGMDYQKPVYTHRMVYIPGVYNKLEDVQARARDHSSRLIEQINTLLSSAEKRISRFVGEWFRKFDQLPEASEFFTLHLSDDVNWQMQDGQFRGHQGFRDWYAITRRTFKPGCDHRVEQVEVKPLPNNRYEAELRIRLLADTFDDSEWQGQSINLLVNENWQVELDKQGNITIHDYQVTPVA